MGFFSFKTADTQESINNIHSPRPHSKPVFMLTPDGNHICEPAYEGYGDFGGIDAYAWLAEINGYGYDRNKGIDLFFDGDYLTLRYPLKFSFNPHANYDALPASIDCEHQGFFCDGIEL